MSPQLSWSMLHPHLSRRQSRTTAPCRSGYSAGSRSVSILRLRPFSGIVLEVEVPDPEIAALRPQCTTLGWFLGDSPPLSRERGVPASQSGRRWVGAPWPCSVHLVRVPMNRPFSFQGPARGRGFPLVTRLPGPPGGLWSGAEVAQSRLSGLYRRSDPELVLRGV